MSGAGQTGSGESKGTLLTHWNNFVPSSEEGKGTLLNYWNNFVPASEPWLEEKEQPTLRQVWLNGAGSQHTLSHYAVSSP